MVINNLCDKSRKLDEIKTACLADVLKLLHCFLQIQLLLAFAARYTKTPEPFTVQILEPTTCILPLVLLTELAAKVFQSNHYFH